jgi:hypothetical protein
MEVPSGDIEVPNGYFTTLFSLISALLLLQELGQRVKRQAHSQLRNEVLHSTSCSEVLCSASDLEELYKYYLSPVCSVGWGV